MEKHDITPGTSGAPTTPITGIIEQIESIRGELHSLLPTSVKLSARALNTLLDKEHLTEGEHVKIRMFCEAIAVTIAGLLKQEEERQINLLSDKK